MVLESLEKRLAPAGIVSVVLTGGALKITGDTVENLVTIQETSEGVYKITGNEDTLISFDGDEGGSFDITGVTAGLTIDLKEGGDTLTLGSMSVAGNLSVALGAGNNEMTLLGTLQVTGDLSVTALNDADSFSSGMGSSLAVTGKTSFNLGNGGNEIRMMSMANLNFGKGLAYTGGTGLDDVVLDADTISVGGAVDLKLGAGGGTAQLIGDSLTILGAYSLTALDIGNGQVLSTLSGGDVFVGGNVTLKLGNGSSNNTLSAENSLSINGSVSVTTGNGNEATVDHRTSINGDVVFVAGSVTVVNGAGDHLVGIGGGSEVEIGGKVSVSNGVGRSSTMVGAEGRLEIGDSVIIANKAGAHNNSISANDLHVTNAITITNAGTGTVPAAQMMNDIQGTTGLHVGAINITNGAGASVNRVTMVEQGEEGDTFYSTGVVTKGITIKNGNGPSNNILTTSVAGVSPSAFFAGSDTILDGSFAVGGNIAITNGTGGFSNQIGTDQTGQFIYVGGSVAITNGNAGYASNTNRFEAEGLTVNKGITLKGGTSFNFTNNEIEVSTVNVIGALSISSGNHNQGGITNSFEMGTAKFGSITISNGNGGSVNSTFQSGLLEVTGALNLTNGSYLSSLVNVMQGEFIHLGSLTIKSGNASAITNDFEYGALSVAGAVSITNGNLGSNTLGSSQPGLTNSFEGSSLNLGSLTIKSGNGAVYNRVQSNQLNVEGAVSITSGAGAGTGTYEIDANRVSIGGAVTFASISGSTENNLFSDDLKIGSLAITHGNGNDLVRVGNEEGTLFINGNVAAKLGAGDTNVSLGRGSNSLTIGGGVSVTALAGDDFLDIEGDGRLIGAVTTSFGVSEEVGVLITGNGVTSAGGLYVGGALNVTAGANAALTVRLRDGSFGVTTITGDAGEDDVEISAAQMRGAVKIDLKAGEDFVSIDDSTFHSSLTLSTGAGEDGVSIEGDDEPEAAGSTRFFGVVNIDLGTENDSLRLGRGVPATAIIFYNAVTLNGGAGGNDLNPGGTVTYLGGQPTLLGFDA